LLSVGVFNFQAERKYATLAGDDEHVGWKYFKRFKMKLLTQVRKYSQIMYL